MIVSWGRFPILAGCLTKDNLIRLYDAPTSTGFGTPMILSGHQRRAGVDGVLALVSLQGQLVSAGRDGRIIVWKDGNQVPQGEDGNRWFTDVHQNGGWLPQGG